MTNRVRRIYVPLSEPAVDALLATASRQWRAPQIQAGLYVLEGLVRAGALPPDIEFPADEPIAVREVADAISHA